VAAFTRLARALNDAGVRYVVIGVWGANHYATSAGTVFRTEDRDLFLPSEPHNLLQCGEACAAAGLRLWGEREPLDQPVDRWLAERVVERRALTRASTSEIRVDLTLVMQGFEFETVWNERRTFRIEGEDIPVARLLHIVTSKHAAGRDKDRLFLATHREALEELLRQEDSKKGP
jgi:hypothetical protein